MEKKVLFPPSVWPVFPPSPVCSCCTPQTYVLLSFLAFKNARGWFPLKKKMGRAPDICASFGHTALHFCWFEPLFVAVDKTLSTQHLYCVTISRLPARRLVIVAGNGCSQRFSTPTTSADNIQSPPSSHQFRPQRVKWRVCESGRPDINTVVTSLGS